MHVLSTFHRFPVMDLKNLPNTPHQNPLRSFGAGQVGIPASIFQI
jgi:hypothetical protein